MLASPAKLQPFQGLFALPCLQALAYWQVLACWQVLAYWQVLAWLGAHRPQSRQLSRLRKGAGCSF